MPSWLPVSGRSSPGDAGEAAPLVLAIQEFVANGGGRAWSAPAGGLHRRGGRAAVAVSVGVAVGVPSGKSCGQLVVVVVVDGKLQLSVSRM